MSVRHQTRTVRVGNNSIGGSNRISVQSMTTTDTRDIAATSMQIAALADAGCDIVRVAVPDMTAADALESIVRETPLPVVADIHFDYRIALRAIAAGVAKVRVNPGNIGTRDAIRAVANAVKAAGIAVRIGVNAGSLPPAIIAQVEKGDVTLGEAMARCALSEAALFEEAGCTDIVLSVKAARVPATVEAYRCLADRCDYPLHLGVTEAGTKRRGTIVSAAGIGALLLEGIGDTIRVSLTASPLEEVIVGRQLLSALELRSYGPTVISCPTCGRCEIDVESIATALEERITREPVLRNTDCRIAVMGCIVNGPGEARDADIGFAGGKQCGVLFTHGEKQETIPACDAVERVLQEMRTMIKKHVIKRER